MTQEWLNSNKTLKTAGIIFLGFATLLLFVLTIGSIRSWHDSSSPLTDKPQITVSGKGEVTAIPDIAQFSFSVTETGKTTKEAQDLATIKTNKAISYLKSAKIEDKDIKTVGYSINPKYEYQTKTCLNNYPCTPGTQVLTGYEVSQSIQVKVRDTNQAGTILSGIGSIGVQNVSGLDLTIDDQTALTNEARKKAIDDAEIQAKTLADQLGVHLVRIVSFQEQGNSSPLFYAKDAVAPRAMASEVAAPEIPKGENTITSNVTIAYEIR